MRLNSSYLNTNTRDTRALAGAYLKEVGRQYGKEIEIHLKDNGKMLKMESIDKL